MITGSCEGYRWVVTPSYLPQLSQAVVRSHIGMHLCITSFDSGPLLLNRDEIALGWHRQGKVMVSPPLTASLVIPHEQYDEWYIHSAPEFGECPIEVFVNYGSFTLVSPDVIDQGRDPTWERDPCEVMVRIQDRFWSQLMTFAPETYVAMGDNTVVVSRNQKFIDTVKGAA